jgi:hypothetical protein
MFSLHLRSLRLGRISRLGTGYGKTRNASDMPDVNLGRLLDKRK